MTRWSSDRQPSKAQREKQAESRRLNRDPLTPCLRDFLTCPDHKLLGNGELPADMKAKYNRHTLEIVGKLLRTAKADFGAMADVSPSKALTAFLSANGEVFKRVAGLPQKPVEDIVGDTVDEGIRLIDRGKDVPLPIPEEDNRMRGLEKSSQEEKEGDSPAA
jgi:hypothetical protein